MCVCERERMCVYGKFYPGQVFFSTTATAKFYPGQVFSVPLPLVLKNLSGVKLTPARTSLCVFPRCKRDTLVIQDIR